MAAEYDDDKYNSMRENIINYVLDEDIKSIDKLYKEQDVLIIKDDLDLSLEVNKIVKALDNYYENNIEEFVHDYNWKRLKDHEQIDDIRKYYYLIAEKISMLHDLYRGNCEFKYEDYLKLVNCLG